MFSKTIRRAALAVFVAMVGVGLTAAPAMAESGTGGVATHDTAVASTVPAPDGVSPAAWSAALGEAQSKFGAGDKAALEAMKQVDLMAVTYCMVYDNITVGGAWYKIPASTSSAGFSCVLESGVNSQGVSALQQTLNKCYGRSLVVDGAFGPATYNALMYAQGVAGIAVDGVYGSGSRKNLKWWGGGSVCTKGTTLGL